LRERSESGSAAFQKPAYLRGELGKLLEVEVRFLLVLLGVNDHGLILVCQLARDTRVLVRLIGDAY
jgi:hypothetical protein